MPHNATTILITADDSPTLRHARTGETYHSMSGAIQESRHVYIEAGLLAYVQHISKNTVSVSVLEIGFGTGLNAILTAVALRDHPFALHYTGIEPYPISPACVTDYTRAFHNLFSSEIITFWEELHRRLGQHGGLTRQSHMGYQQHFQLERITLDQLPTKPLYDVIYMDAFSPKTEPDLWTLPALKKLAGLLSPGGHIVTYCAKGDVRRGFVSAGLTVERLKGPPGKWEMLRATRP